MYLIDEKDIPLCPCLVCQERTAGARCWCEIKTAYENKMRIIAKARKIDDLNKVMVEWLSHIRCQIVADTEVHSKFYISFEDYLRRER